MTAILFVALVIALTWGAVVFLRGGLLGGCLLVLLAGCCFGQPFFRLPVGPVPLTAGRLLWVVLLMQYVVWRRWGLANPKPLGAAEVILCAFVGVLLVSTFTHDWQADQAQPLARLIIFCLMPFGIYWVARQSAFSERGILRMFGCLAVFGVYLAVTAWAETRGLWWMVFPKYIASDFNPDFLGRGRGPMLNPSGCGIFQSVCLFGALMWWPRLNRPGRLLLLFTSLLFCVGIYSTFTRSAWMGAGFGLLILLALTLPRVWRAPILGGSLLTVALLAATHWEHLMAFKRDRDLDAQAAAESVELRPVMAMVAWNMFLDRPLFGCGLGHYSDQSCYYLADRSTALPLEKARPYCQHNAFLSLLTETGLLGMGLFLTLLGVWIRDAWRVWRSGAAPPWARHQALLFLALVGSYLANAMFHDVSIIPMVNMLLFFMAGVTAGLRPFCEPAKSPASSGAPVGTWSPALAGQQPAM